MAVPSRYFAQYFVADIVFHQARTAGRPRSLLALLPEAPLALRIAAACVVSLLLAALLTHLVERPALTAIRRAYDGFRKAPRPR
jgi:peptidoglycan/LPS O-acetylase OafA/YrhL